MVGGQRHQADDGKGVEVNEHKIRQEQLAQQRRQFAQAVARGQLSALDRFGHPLSEGDDVLLRGDADPVFTVAAVGPVVDPNLPPGLMQVTLTTTFQYRVQAGQPAAPIVIIGRRRPVIAPPNGQDPSLAPDTPCGGQVGSADPEPSA